MGKTCPVFGNNRLRFSEKPAPFLGKTCPVFGKNRLRFWEKHAPFLGNTCSVFGKNMPRFWEEQAPFAPFLGKNGSISGEIGLLFGLAWDKAQQKIRFRRRLALFGKKRWLRFWAIKRFRFLRKLGKSVTDFEETGHRF